jgi:hypothetical protein
LSARARRSSIRKRRPNWPPSPFLDLFIPKDFSACSSDLFFLQGLRGDFVGLRIPKELEAVDRFCPDPNKSQRKLRYPVFRTVPHREMLAFVPFDEHVCRLDKGR